MIFLVRVNDFFLFVQRIGTVAAMGKGGDTMVETVSHLVHQRTEIDNQTAIFGA